MCRAAGAAAFLFLLLAGAPAAAHDLWLEPSTFQPAPHGLVSVTVLVGQGFAGDTVPRDPEHIARFVLDAAGGAVPVVGLPGADPAGAVRVGDAGAAMLLYRGLPQPITLEAGKFESYLLEEGLEHVIQARAGSGQAGKPARERFGRCAKALLAVGGTTGSPSPPPSCPFEIVLAEDPPATAGKPLAVRLLWNGGPAARVLVRARCKDAPERVWSARTDAMGRVSVPLDRAGVWLLTAVHMTAAPKGSDADWLSEWASLMLEVE